MATHKRMIYATAGVIWLAFTAAGLAGTPTPLTLKKGQELFDANCAFCHQADAVGKPGVAPSLTNPELLAIASDTFFMATIREGRVDTGMPPFAHLGQKNLRAIVAYLRSHANGPSRAAEVAAQPDAHGDPRLGKVSDGFIRETIKKGRSNTRMLAFQGPAGLANLSDREIDDIIVYLRDKAKK